MRIEFKVGDNEFIDVAEDTPVRGITGDLLGRVVSVRHHEGQTFALIEVEDEFKYWLSMSTVGGMSILDNTD